MFEKKPPIVSGLVHDHIIIQDGLAAGWLKVNGSAGYYRGITWKPEQLVINYGILNEWGRRLRRRGQKLPSYMTGLLPASSSYYKWVSLY
jgi:hypothetical protein